MFFEGLGPPDRPSMRPIWFQVGLKLGYDEVSWAKIGVRQFKMDRMSDKMKQDAPRWPQGGPQVGPGWPQDGPRGPQDGTKRAQEGTKDSPKRAQDEAKMAQHGASDSKLKPKGRNIKNLQKHIENQCFLRVQGLRIGPT